MCRSTLLPGSYTQGSEAGSLICTHHSKSSHRVFNQQIGSADSRPKRASQTGHFSLGGLAITTVPHYTKKTESQDRLVGKTAETEGRDSQERSREVKDGLQSIVRKPARSHLPPPSVKDRAIEEAGKAGPAAILADSKTEQEVTEGSSRPVPAPRRMLGSSVVPVPAPRTKTSQETNSSSAAGKWTPCDIILLSLFCLCVDIKSCPFLLFHDWVRKKNVKPFFVLFSFHAQALHLKAHLTCKCTESLFSAFLLAQNLRFLLHFSWIYCILKPLLHLTHFTPVTYSYKSVKYGHICFETNDAMVEIHSQKTTRRHQQHKISVLEYVPSLSEQRETVKYKNCNAEKIPYKQHKATKHSRKYWL